MEQLPLFSATRSTPTSSRRTIPVLSKSRFAAGLQCHKRLYFECHRTIPKDPLAEATKALFEMGRRVGVVARGRHPGGVLIDTESETYDEAVRGTREALACPKTRTIYEGAFAHDDLRTRVDILDSAGDGTWDLIEVKSSSGFKEDYLADIGIQLLVLEGAGIPIRRACLLHVNNQYLYEGGPYDLERLFTMRDLTEPVRELLPRLAEQLRAMRVPLQASEPPDIPAGAQCKRPYLCPYYDHCHSNAPEHPLESMPRMGQKLLRALREAEIDDIRDIPEDFDGLTDLHRRIRASVITGRVHRDPELRQALAALTPPIHFLDFESCNPALPRFAGTRPFQQVPFQWSHHVLRADGTLDHYGFLHVDPTDPRGPLVESLVRTLGEEGPIVVYSGFEARILQSLAQELPRWSDALHAIVARMKDLLELIRTHYYHPDFKGSFSIKDVLPALIEDLRYTDLRIREGAQAATAFIEMIDPATSTARRDELGRDLEAYCRRDTEAMVRLFQKLREDG